MSPIYYDTEILNTHGSTSNDTVIRVEDLMARKDAEYTEDPARKVCNSAEDPATTRVNTTKRRNHLPPAQYKS